jgi:hypothetical protein
MSQAWVRGNAHLLSVVLLPEEGLPTSPIKGSRGIVNGVAEGTAGYHKRKMDVENLTRLMSDLMVKIMYDPYR